jgi:effector-binding domain-containing protein
MINQMMMFMPCSRELMIWGGVIEYRGLMQQQPGPPAHEVGTRLHQVAEGLHEEKLALHVNTVVMDAPAWTSPRIARRTASSARLYHMALRSWASDNMPASPISIRTLWPQHCLVIRCRVPRRELAATIGECIGRIKPHATSAGGVLVGAPFVRYLQRDVESVTIEVGLRLMMPVASGDGIEASMLPGGRMAVAVHAQSHAQLPDTYAALENWLMAEGELPDGAAWETYVTDPQDRANLSHWRTEIFQPLR